MASTNTFLAMVNTVRREAGVAGGDLTTLQGAVSTETSRFKDWVSREYVRVLTEHPDMQCLRQTVEFPLTAGVNQYTPAQVGAISTPAFTADQFGSWKIDSFRIYSDSNYGNEMLAAFMPWDQFRNVYLYATMRSQESRPVAISLGPDKSLWFGITPDATGWRFDGEMYLAPQPLVNDADTTLFPPRFADLVVFRALRAYGMFMSAPEVVQRAQTEINAIRPQLLLHQLPIITSGPPLA